MANNEDGQVGQALVDFALSGAFPEEPLSSGKVMPQELGPALGALAQAKSKLESEIHTINEETAPGISQWVAKAKSLEDDINRTRSMANDIIRRSEAPEVSGRTVQEAEDKVNFLQQETNYNQQVRNALTSIKNVSRILDEVEEARDERRILDSLRFLESAWAALDEIPVSKSCRVMKLLNLKAFELKSAVHDVFDHVWGTLVQVDVGAGTLAVLENVQDEPMSLSDAVIGLKAYKEVDQRMALLWHAMDAALILPRTSARENQFPAIKLDNATLRLQGQADRGISSLFNDLSQVLTYLSNRLPKELLQSLSNVMMPDLIPRLISTWLDPAVPISLEDMHNFQSVTDTVREFCKTIGHLHFTGFSELQEWVESSPRIWLSKCRETALDSVRAKLSEGLGDPQKVERVETQTVSKLEGMELAATATATAAGTTTAKMGQEDDDWGAAWEDDGATTNKAPESDATRNEDDGTDAWGWGDEVAHEDKPNPDEKSQAQSSVNDDGGDAWGWGDDDDAAQAVVAPPVAAKEAQTREMTLRETYNISALPAPVLALIATILEDGASLASDNSNPVASAVAGMFSLPTLVLAMFRAVSPYYYSLNEGGNMFLYNDATYLSEELAKFTSTWKARTDLAPRAVTMLRLDNEIQALQSFATRAYSTEMAMQRTVIRDLLGGSQNLLQQDGLESSDLEVQVDGAIGRVRDVAATWSGILAPSAWNQAIGSLVDTIAAKLASDVMDLAGIGQDEAYNIATMIAHVEKLDDLFPGPPGAEGDTDSPPPQTAQYASTWLRLKYLGEVLQSNLQDILWLWKDSGLSLEFSATEVVDLIRLSFVDNARTRDVIKQIEANPHPQETAE
ncbi:protein transport protein DSL1/ZW10 [Microdochium nivale]|nr:protein transport protein DSL1/ZW10 [Microdochium nivale]